ncbi:hypothetical protein [Arthrobacter sp. 35/47]|uniref:hypothetical protein n=1 Tax=Arthrobacter sp. 35/47 TaxID=269454 RepID=UPI0004798E5C|nr:hypothetical protein [Arthrobacter sp. 35/47]
MNTRSCLLTVGVSALLATGPVLAAVPASAAPGSPQCVSAQAALTAQIGVASVDIALANQLREALASFESIGAQLEPLYLEADLAVADELAALDAADIAAYDASVAAGAAAAILRTSIDAETSAEADLAAAEQAVLEVPEGDAAALAEAERLRDEAQARLTIATAAREQADVDATAAQETSLAADAAFTEANEAFLAAADAAYASPAILALEAQFDDAAASFDDAFIRLGLTEGTDPQQLLALADAAADACSAPAAGYEPVVRAAPAQRGMNIQTAAYDAGTTGPADLALLARLAGFGAAATVGAGVVVRRLEARRVRGN